MKPAVHILVLAAGASSRMRGSDKLLQPLRGRPLLRHVVDAAMETRSAVTVSLPSNADSRKAVLAALPLRIIEVPDAELGMSRSICRGLTAISAAAPGPQDGLMILPGDMPGFTGKVLSDLISRFRATPDLVFRGGTVDGQAGHPAIFPRDLWDELAAVTGDEGGRSVLQRHRDRVRVIPLPGPMAVLDLDTPEDWAAYLGRPLPSD
jgi:molybdenum cofactor cytidylyltransferase